MQHKKSHGFQFEGNTISKAVRNTSFRYQCDVLTHIEYSWEIWLYEYSIFVFNLIFYGSMSIVVVTRKNSIKYNYKWQKIEKVRKKWTLKKQTSYGRIKIVIWGFVMPKEYWHIVKLIYLYILQNKMSNF